MGRGAAGSPLITGPNGMENGCCASRGPGSPSASGEWAAGKGFPKSVVHCTGHLSDCGVPGTGLGLGLGQGSQRPPGAGERLALPPHLKRGVRQQ